MDHIQAIDNGLASHTPYSEIARKIFLTYPTKVFIGKEDLQYEILNSISEHFNIPIASIQIVGSAKLGYSIHKKSDFMSATSDLDVAIIDAQLFIRYLEKGLKISKGYSDGTKFAPHMGRSSKESYIQYLSKGIFRPDLMPIGEDRASWHNFFGVLSTKYSQLFTSISAAIYLSQSSFESKQRSVIKNRATNGAI